MKTSLRTHSGSGASRDGILRLGIIAMLSLTLGACALLGKKEPVQIMDPIARVSPSAEWPQARWSLHVQRPVASQSLDTERIIVRPNAGAMQVYKGAAWSDPAPDLVQTSLLRAFEDSGRILSIARPGGAIRGDFQLASELRAFESIYAGATPDAVVELHVRLVRAADGKAVAARTFRATEPAGGTDVEMVSAAFSRALVRIDGEVVGWTLQQGNQAGP